jgi:molybdenum cofactor synthesis domain-containing protein
MRVALITVGDEILSGDTVNNNATWLGDRLTASGATVERITAIPDRVADIAKVVNEYRAAYDAVIVTGGLGPTHDDVTMAGVAAAFGTELAAEEAVEQWLTEEAGYSADDLAPETTHIPDGAEFLPNPEGVAPGCTIGNVYVLPGLPTEMKAMFDLIADEFGGDVRHVATVETAEPESELLDRIEALRDRFDVIVGSYPGENVRLKIEGYDEETVQRAAEWLESNVDPPA